MNSVYQRDPSQVFRYFQDSTILMNFLHIKILEKSKRSSYQSVINSVSCIKPFDKFDFVCRVLFSHVFLLLVVEQGHLSP